MGLTREPDPQTVEQAKQIDMGAYLRDHGWLTIRPGEHLMVDDPFSTEGDECCLLCGRGDWELPDECERSVSG